MERSLSRGAAVCALFLANGIVGCSNNLSTLSSQQRFHAPQSAVDTGIVIHNADINEISLFITNHPQDKFRILNSNHGLYEIFTADHDGIAQTFGTRANQNRFFKVLDQGPAVPATAAPSDCREATSKPQAHLSGPDVALVGQQFVFAASSKAADGFPSDLKISWIVTPPSTSLQKETTIYNDQLQWTPDSMGIYTVTLTAQDSRGVCAVDTKNIVVTSNTPYLPSQQAQVLQLPNFLHLDLLKSRETWPITQGAHQIIAVVDSGVNYNHPSITGHIHINPNEIPNNGIDDDKNGFIDDVYGYDFANSDPYPYDDDGHGSHVTGLIVGTGFGTAQQAEILPVKVTSPLGGDAGTIAAGVLYATDQKVSVINISIGAYGPVHPALTAAMDYAEKNGVLVIAAAGNGHPIFQTGLDTDSYPNYPSSLPNANIVSVTASDFQGLLAPYANFGKKTVHVIAPGGIEPDQEVMSCDFENPLGRMFLGRTGTSMSAPLVAGIAAQILNLNPQWTALQVKETLMEAGDDSVALKSKIASGKILTADAAIKLAIERRKSSLQ